MARNAAAGNTANVFASFASFMPVEASEQDDQSSDPSDREVEEYVAEACAAGRLYLIV